MDRILIVEDTTEFQMLIRRALAPTGADLIFASTAETARVALRSETYSLVILDIGLPDGDGFNLCQEIQNEATHKHTPIIFLTGKQEPTDVVAGFSLGAEDYVTKPFHPLALRARVEARLRSRNDRVEKSTVLDVGSLRVDLAQMRTTQASDGQEVALTPTEFKILYYLAKNKDHVLSRDQILDQVRGKSVNVSDRTVDTHISTLRRKIAGSGVLIEAVPNAGYRLTSVKPGVNAA